MSSEGRQIYLTKRDINALASLVELQMTGLQSDIDFAKERAEWASVDEDPKNHEYWLGEAKSSQDELEHIKRLEKKLWYHG